MKITKIEKKEGIFYVTQTPNFFQRLFGVKEKTEKYKWKGEVFKHFDHIKVFYKSNGEILSFTNKICKALNNYEQTF